MRVFIFRAVQNALSSDSNILQPDAYDLKAPIYDPQKLICIGLNYRDHCTEQNVEVPKEPLIFSKFSSAITEPNGVVELSDLVTVRGFTVWFYERSGRKGGKMAGIYFLLMSALAPMTSFLQELDFEVEMAFVMGKAGRNIKV